MKKIASIFPFFSCRLTLLPRLCSNPVCGFAKKGLIFAAVHGIFEIRKNAEVKK